LLGNGKESVGIKIVKTLKDIEREGKKPFIREMMRRGLSPTSLSKYIPKLTDLGIIIENYPDPTKKHPQYKVNSDYDWIIDLIE
jgi:DNA-binding transcriptional ArsR family regulator